MPQPVLWSFLEKKKLIFVSDSCALNVQKSGMLTYLFDLNKNHSHLYLFSDQRVFEWEEYE